MLANLCSKAAVSSRRLSATTNIVTLSLRNHKHTDNKYVVRNTYKLVKPKYATHSYAMSHAPGIHLLCDTVGDRLASLAAEKPASVAYKFCLGQTSFTFAELKQRVDEIAQSLLALGFAKGDRLAIMLPNVPELNLTLLAASSLGVVVVLMNPGYQQVEIEYMLKKTRAKGIVILDNLRTLRHYDALVRLCPELAETAAGAAIASKALPDLKHVVVVANKLMKDASSEYKGAMPFESIEKAGASKRAVPHVDFDDTFVLMFTSGTTGLPKAAALSHYNIINSAYMDIYNGGMIDESDVICVPIPIFHSFGLITGVVEPLICGGKAVFPSFLPDTLATLKAIHAERCTSIKGAPVIYIDLVNHPERKNYDLSSLKYMLVGASTVPKDLMLKIKNELKIKNTIIGFGMTESSAAGLITKPDYGEDEAYGTIGQPFPFMEVKIVDENRRMVPYNTEGEICMRGYGIMKGYWDDPQKTAETIDENGWLHTGDVGSMSEHGYVSFKSRAKEIIIRGGVNIYPAEVESFIRTHNQVLDVYCVGLPDERVGEEICVWVKLKPDSTVTEDDLKKFCQDKIAYFKVPKYIKFVDAFPINANGKVQKFKMVEQMKKELKL